MDGYITPPTKQYERINIEKAIRILDLERKRRRKEELKKRTLIIMKRLNSAGGLDCVGTFHQ